MTAPITVAIDSDANAAYISLSEKPVARTRRVTDDVNVDLDDMDVVVGIECLRLAADLPFQRLKDEFHVHSEVIEGLRYIQPSVAQFMTLTSWEREEWRDARAEQWSWAHPATCACRECGTTEADR